MSAALSLVAFLDEFGRAKLNPARMKTSFKGLLVLSAIALAIAGCSTTKETGGTKENWTTLFNGESTDAWTGYQLTTFPTKSWKVENGTLKTIAGGEVRDLMTKEQYQDFELELEWKISPGGNSGIIYRVAPDLAHAWNTGPEMQVLDDSKHNDGKNPKTSAGALYALIAPQNKKLMPVGQWNKVRLVIKNNHVEHWLNGVKVVEYQLGSPELAKLIAESKFKTFPRFAKEKTGHICLQNHHDEVWYRNIRIRRL